MKMTIPERPQISGLVEISVRMDLKKPKGVSVDVSGALSADLNTGVLEEVCRRGGVLSLPGRVGTEPVCRSILFSAPSNVQLLPLAVIIESKYSSPLQGGFSDFNVTSILTSPPPFLNSGRHPSQTGSSPSCCASITAKPPLTLVCIAIRTNHLSTSTHKPKGKHPPVGHTSDVKTPDANAGAEWMEDSIYTRRGKGSLLRRSMFTVVTAGNGGREMAGGVPFGEGY